MGGGGGWLPGISEIPQVEELPILLAGRVHPQAERDRIRRAFVVGDVKGVTAGFELDAAFQGRSGVKLVEIDYRLVVNQQDGSVVRGHAEFVRSGIAHKEVGIIIHAKPNGAVGDAGDAIGPFENLVGYTERFNVDGADGIEFTEVGQLQNSGFELVHIAAESVGMRHNGSVGAKRSHGWGLRVVDGW